MKNILIWCVIILKTAVDCVAAVGVACIIAFTAIALPVICFEFITQLVNKIM